MTGLSKGELVELACAVSSGEPLSSEMAELARRIEGSEPHRREFEEFLDAVRLIRLALAEGKTCAAGACLDDETLAAYVDGALEPSTKRAAETHLSQCRGCLSGLADLAELTERVSATRLVSERRPALRYVIEVARRGLRLLLHPDNEFTLLAPTPAAVLCSEGAECSERQPCCSWRQEVGESTVAVSVIQTGDERVDVSLTIAVGSAPVPKARITLRRDDHIVQSESTSETGRVSLHNLETGEYECELKLPNHDSKDLFTLDVRREQS